MTRWVSTEWLIQRANKTKNGRTVTSDIRSLITSGTTLLIKIQRRRLCNILSSTRSSASTFSHPTAKSGRT